MFKRVLKHAIQRLRYGYDDTLSWGLNINLVEYTYNGLQQMITEGSKVIKWEAQIVKLNNEDITYLESNINYSTTKTKSGTIELTINNAFFILLLPPERSMAAHKKSVQIFEDERFRLLAIRIRRITQ